MTCDSRKQTVVMGTKERCGMTGCTEPATGDNPVLLSNNHAVLGCPVRCWMCRAHRDRLATNLGGGRRV